MAVRFYVAHGASGSSASMRGHVEGLRMRGIDAAHNVVRTLVVVDEGDALPDGDRDLERRHA